jgi:hypothetical protein
MYFGVMPLSSYQILFDDMHFKTHFVSQYLNGKILLGATSKNILSVAEKVQSR